MAQMRSNQGSWEVILGSEPIPGPSIILPFWLLIVALGHDSTYFRGPARSLHQYQGSYPGPPRTYCLGYIGAFESPEGPTI